MPFKPLGQAVVNTTPSNYNNAVSVFISSNILHVVNVTDEANNLIGNVVIPPSTSGGHVIITKRPTERLSLNTGSLTSTTGAVYGSENIPVLKILGAFQTINSTSFSNVGGARTFSVTTSVPSLLTYYSSNNVIAQMVLPGNNIFVLSKNSEVTIISNVDTFATKIGSTF